MFSWIRAYLDSLGGRLLLRIMLALTAVLVVHLLLTLRANRDRLMELTYQHAERTSQLIERATRYGMLLNRKEDVHETIRRISGTSEVAGIRIFDKTGAVAFSTDENEVGHLVDMQAEACVGCHLMGNGPIREVADPRIRRFRRPDGELALGLTRSIENAKECSSVGCHVHPSKQSVLAVLDVQMSLGDVEQAMAGTSERTAWLSVLLMGALAAVCGVFIHRVVRKPIIDIERRMEGIASGDLESRVHTSGTGELVSLARNFNRMTDDLRRARDELTVWSETLETKILDKTRELNRTQRRIVQIEKMASLGRLSATVAHELNNPLSGIVTYAKLVERTLDEGPPTDKELAETKRYLEVIRGESSRCGDIVRNLLVFARKTSASFEEHRLRQIMERSLMLVRHSIELAGVQLEFEPPDGDERIECDGNQIEQALIAILINAIESMPSGGTLRFSGFGNADRVSIVIRDSGVGIPKDVLPEIFEPFFSTKDQNMGVGLGLSVVYGIVRRHEGQIDVQTSPETGTVVTVDLPRRPPADSAHRKPAEHEPSNISHRED